MAFNALPRVPVLAWVPTYIWLNPHAARHKLKWGYFDCCVTPAFGFVVYLGYFCGCAVLMPAWFRISATSVPCPCFCRSIAVSHLLAFQPACLPCFRSVPVFSLTLPRKGLSCLNCPNVISGFPFPDFRRTRKQSTLLKHFDGMPSFTAICFMVQCNGWEL